MPPAPPTPPQHRLRRPTRTLAAVLAAAALAAGCGGPATRDVPGAAGRPASAGSALNLKEVCPARAVIQSGWLPQADFGELYQLFSGGYTLDTNRMRVSGPLMAGDVDTGVTLEVRSGGPAIDFATGSAQLYADPSIMMVTRPVDESVVLSATQPTLTVLAPLSGDPMALIWDPATYPDFNSISDIGQTNTRVVYRGGNTYMAYLTGTGILRPGQVDPSYDGSPARFVASGGRVVVQGFATNEPEIYEHEVKSWSRPVRYQLVQDTNFPNYANALAIRPRDRQGLDGCLRRLVPILQQAQVGFLTHPEVTLARIVSIVAAFHTSFRYSAVNAAFAARQLVNPELSLTGNDRDRVLGRVDPGRVQRLINIIKPIAAGQRKPVKDGLTPADLATNDYVSPGIGLPGGGS